MRLIPRIYFPAVRGKARLTFYVEIVQARIFVLLTGLTFSGDTPALLSRDRSLMTTARSTREYILVQCSGQKMRTMMPRRALKKRRLRIDMWADESSSDSESKSEILRKPEHEGSAGDVTNASDEEASEDASTSNASAVSATVKQGDNAGLIIAANVETNHAVDSPEMGINQEDVNAEDDEDDWTALCQDIEENINKSTAAAAAAALPALTTASPTGESTSGDTIDTARRTAVNTDHCSAAFPLGARVAKRFGGVLHLGTVTSVPVPSFRKVTAAEEKNIDRVTSVDNAGNDNSDGGGDKGDETEHWHWHVVYDDGDEEDYDEDEVREGVELFRSLGHKDGDRDSSEKGGGDNINTTAEGSLLVDTDDESGVVEEQARTKREEVSTERAKRLRRKRLLDRRAAKSCRNNHGDGGDANVSSNDDDSDQQEGRPRKRKKRTRRRRRKMVSESAEARRAQAEERERARERKRWRRDRPNYLGADENTTGSWNEGGVEANGTGTCKGMAAAAATAKVVVINQARPDSESAVEIASDLAVRLKPHQIDGVRFMWKSLIHSFGASNNEAGRGAILAHSMGLGKSLQIVTFLHTVLLHKALPFRNAIVLGPKNTLYNWWDEFQKWGADEELDIYLVDPAVHKSIAERVKVVQKWHGGSQVRPSVLLMSYDQFKMLVGERPRARQRKSLRQRLLDPGPDLAALDEGHIIANPKTSINSAVMGMKTRRRLILTGTPLSNNLLEYHSMVAFVHRDLLSTSSEFRSRFVLPIEAGQFMDATDYEVRLMKRRVHVLSQKLKPVVHRRGYDILTQSLPPKFEYVISVRLDDVQKKLYREFLDRRKKGAEETSFLHAWHSLQRIWNHPRAIEFAEEQRRENEKRATLKREMSNFIDDSEVSSHDGESEEEMSWHGSDSEEEKEEEDKDDLNLNPPASNGEERAPPSSLLSREKRQSDRSGKEEPKPVEEHWWKKILGKDFPVDLASESSKFQVLRDILTNLHVGDKVAIFSQSLGVLELIEEWLEHNGGFNHGGSDEIEFCRGIDFLRIDGSTSSERRQHFCNKINDTEDPARVVLISVKAGSLGINLVGVNRVVLFDTSFNPTHDVQAIFRAYRYGQERPVSIYRLVASGTMEERIYRRQVEKRALFSRVVDEHQIERHFARVDVEQMIRLDENEAEEARQSKISKIHYKSHCDAPPSDLLFAKVLKEDGGRKLPRYHEHDSLLENKEEEELTKEEKKDAWAEFEKVIAGEKTLPYPQRPAMACAASTGQAVAPTTPGGVRFYSQQPYYTQQTMPHPATGPVQGLGAVNSDPRRLPSVSLAGITNYDVIRSIRLSVPGPLGINVCRIDSTGRRDDRQGQFSKIEWAKPEMHGASCGLQDNDIFLYPGTSQMIPFQYFVSTLSKVRPLVLDVARAKAEKIIYTKDGVVA